MKTISFITLALMLISYSYLKAQSNQVKTALQPENYTVFNREVSYEDGTAHLNAQDGDGLLWLNHSQFKNGVIELDLKGRNAPGQSFVGVAFHDKDDQTFDAVYFRPFNFKNPERRAHSVQYVAMPKYDWSALREAFPGTYENTISPLPEPMDDWFHAKIVVHYPQVKVYVNGSEQSTLEVKQLSETKQGKVGFWVGNGSEGWFKNLTILSKP